MDLNDLAIPCRYASTKQIRKKFTTPKTTISLSIARLLPPTAIEYPEALHGPSLGLWDRPHGSSLHLLANAPDMVRDAYKRSARAERVERWHNAAMTQLIGGPTPKGTTPKIRKKDPFPRGAAFTLAASIFLLAGVLIYRTIEPAPQTHNLKAVTVQLSQVRVIDGDTIAIPHSPLITLELVDTPQLKGQCERERELALKAKAFTTAFVKRGNVLIQPVKTDQFGRIIATVQVGPDDLGQSLLDAGLAHASYKAPQSWCATTPKRGDH